MFVINYGTDIIKNTYDALAASDISAYLKSHFAVAIKPNLVVSRPASEGATTHPEVVEGIVRFLKDFGVSNISIIESAWIGDSTHQAFTVCGYESISKKYDIPLICLKSDACTTLEYQGIRMEICNRALDTNFLINVPVLKAHCQTNLTCNMKNLKGCIPDSEKRRFHTLGLHRPIAALNALVKTGYCVIDGICGDLTFEEGGNPTYAHRIIVGRDPVMLDSYCAELIGYNPSDIEYLNLAKKWGLGNFYSPDSIITELNANMKPSQTIIASSIAARYAKQITEDGACSACYAALVHALHRTKANGKFHIGQGYRSKTTDGVGIGNCTSGLKRYIPGCPSKATDIIEGL